MKKATLTVAVILTLCGSMLTSSCIGKFALTNRVLAWNNQVGNKFLNELVFFAFWILPVYEVTALADLVVLNTIEFWSGSNPMASSSKIVEGSDGRYLVECDGKGYTITSQTDGSTVRLDFDSDTSTWWVNIPDAEPMQLMTIIDDTHVALPAPDGKMTVIESSQAGLMAYRQIVSQSFFAQR